MAEEVQLHSFVSSALGGRDWSSSLPGRSTPGKEHWYPLSRRQRGLQCPSGRFEEETNFLPLTGFENRNFQSVA